MDLIDEETFKEISEKIAEINPAVKIYAATHCDVDIKSIVEHFSPNTASSEETTNTYETRPTTFIVKCDEPIEKDVYKRQEYERSEKILHSYGRWFHCTYD